MLSLSSIFLILIKREQWRRKWVVVSISRPQAHKHKRDIISNFTPLGLFISKTLQATGLTNFKRDNLRTFKESLLGITRSCLFHSVIVEGKMRISEKVTPGFDIGYIIDLTASSRIKLHSIWN